MHNIPQISEAELEVMKVVWELGKATSSQIIERLTVIKDWKPKTVQTLITRLVAKGAIRAQKTESKAFIYSPQVNEGEYKIHASNSFVQKMYNGSVKMMLASFIKEQKLSQEELRSLKELLDEDV